MTWNAPSYIPHTRGDGPKICEPWEFQTIYSPHAWGWSVHDVVPSSTAKIFPTRVGMVRVADSNSNHRSDIPHTRGDGPECNYNRDFSIKYSPHAWGWSGRQIGGYVRLEIFPTRVGMVRSNYGCHQSSRDIPHTRGDGPIPCFGVRVGVTYSPHAWGWSVQDYLNREAIDIFPTRVGMVRWPTSSRTRPSNIPHTRGDGPVFKNETF